MSAVGQQMRNPQRNIDSSDLATSPAAVAVGSDGLDSGFESRRPTERMTSLQPKQQEFLRHVRLSPSLSVPLHKTSLQMTLLGFTYTSLTPKASNQKLLLAWF